MELKLLIEQYFYPYLKSNVDNLISIGKSSGIIDFEQMKCPHKLDSQTIYECFNLIDWQDLHFEKDNDFENIWYIHLFSPKPELVEIMSIESEEEAERDRKNLANHGRRLLQSVFA